ERVADRRHPGVGERDPRRALPVGGCDGIPPQDVVGGDPTLVLAHMGEQRAAVDIADRVQPARAVDPKAVVYLEPSARIHPHGLQSDALGARLAADGNEKLLTGDAPPALQLDGDLSVAPADRARL